MRSVWSNLPIGRRPSTQSRDDSKGGGVPSSSSRRTSSKASVSRRESSRSRIDGSRTTLVNGSVGLAVAVDESQGDARPLAKTSELMHGGLVTGDQLKVEENKLLFENL